MKIAVIAAVCLVMLAGCGKDSGTPAPTYTSADGVWTYTTPEKGITVNFELKTTGGTLEILNTTITVGTTDGEAAGQLTGVDLPAIDEIRINANDAMLVVPYVITFSNCVVSGNFAQITASNAVYTYPWGTVKTATGVVIKRK